MRSTRIVALVIVTFAAVTTFMASASAGSFAEDLPAQVAESLGIGIMSAKLMLSLAVLVSIGAVLSISKHSNLMLTIVVLLAAVGFLTAISWLESWLIIFAALIIAIMFGSQLRTWATGGSGSQE